MQVLIIKDVGGDTEGKAVSAAFRAVARDSVWKELNWEGRRHRGRNVIKRGIKTSPVAAAILSKLYHDFRHVK